MYRIVIILKTFNFHRHPMNFLFPPSLRALTRDLVTKQYIVHANIIPDAGLNDGMTM